jgi:hypothetical protein
MMLGAAAAQVDDGAWWQRRAGKVEREWRGEEKQLDLASTGCSMRIRMAGNLSPHTGSETMVKKEMAGGPGQTGAGWSDLDQGSAALWS